MNTRFLFCVILPIILASCNNPNGGGSTLDPDPVPSTYSLTLSVAGGLGNALTADQWAAARELTVAGPMNEADFVAIKTKGVKVARVDLSKAQTTSVPDMAFCLKASSKADEGVTVGMDSLSRVVLPEGTVGIGQNAFAGCRRLTEIVLPSTLRTVGPGAFWQVSIEHLVLPEGVAVVAHEAFVDCPRLRSVMLPSTLDSLGFRAFMRCSALQEIILPPSVTKLGVDLFSECTALRRVRFEGTVELREGMFAGCTALAAIENLPAVRVVPSFLFIDCRSLTQIALPSSVRRIEDGAFRGAGLESVSLPAEEVSWLGASAFEGCTKLRGVEWNGNTSLDTIQQMTFMGCTSLEAVVLPSSVTEIWENVFEGCTALRSVGLPSGLTVLGTWAFKECTSLAEVTIPASLTKGAFNSAPFRGCAALAEPRLAAGSIAVADYLFAGAGVKRITIPSTVTQIGGFAFDSTLLEQIVLSEGVSRINMGAFRNCTKLTSAVLPASLASYSSSLFAGCTALASVTLSPSATQLGDQMFDGCGALKSLIIPASIKVLEYGCLRQTGLESIVLPAGVENINADAFRGCAALTSVRIERTEPPRLNIDPFPTCTVFTGLPADAKLYVPSSAVAAYEAMPNYKNSFSSIWAY